MFDLPPSRLPALLPLFSCTAAIITGLTVTVDTVDEGQISLIQISITSGTDMTMFVILGDGNAQEVTVADSTELCNIEHTYAASGNYPVTVMLHNTRSSQEVTVTAAVCDPIEGATAEISHVAEGSGQSNVLRLNVTRGTEMRAQIILNNGTLREYCFGSSGDIEPIELTFTDVGAHVVDIHLSNAQSSVHLTQIAGVYTPMAGFALQIDSSTALVNTAVTFTQTFTAGSHVTCTREFGDDGTIWRLYDETAETTTTFEHTYAAVGEYTMSLHCFNFGHSYYVKRSIFVTEAVGVTLDANPSDLVALGEQYVGLQTTSSVLQVQATFSDAALSAENILYDGTVILNNMERATLGFDNSGGDDSTDFDLKDVVIPMPHLRFYTPGRVTAWNVQEPDSSNTVALAVVRPHGNGYILVGKTSVTFTTAGSYVEHEADPPIYFQAGDTLGYYYTSGSTQLRLRSTSSGVTCNHEREAYEVCSREGVEPLDGEFLSTCTPQVECIEAHVQAIYQEIDPTAHLLNIGRYMSACVPEPVLDTNVACAELFDGILEDESGFVELSHGTNQGLSSLIITLPTAVPVHYIKIRQGENRAQNIKDLNIQFDGIEFKNVRLRQHLGNARGTAEYAFFDFIPIVPAVTTQTLRLTVDSYYGDLFDALGFYEIEIYTSADHGTLCDPEQLGESYEIVVFSGAETDCATTTGVCGDTSECVLNQHGGGLIKIPADIQTSGVHQLSVTVTGYVDTASATYELGIYQLIDETQVNVTHTPEFSQADTADTTICVNVGPGSHYQLEIDFGDSTTAHTDPDPTHSECVDHRYTRAGILTATITLTNYDGYQVVVTETIPSLRPIASIALVGDDNVDLSAQPYQIRVYVESDGLPTNVSCSVVFKDGLNPVVNILEGFVDNVSGPIDYTYEIGDLGPQTITTTCTNQVSSNFEQTKDVQVMQPLTEAVLTVSSQHVRVGQNVEFKLERTEGSHPAYEMNYQDGNTDSVPFDSGEGYTVLAEKIFNHEYTTVANVTPTVITSNDLGSITQSFPEIVVQQPVPALSMNSDLSSVACPPGVVTITVAQADLGDPAPTDTFLDLTVPGLDLPPQYITLPHDQELTLSCAAAGDVTLSANVSNLISSNTTSLQLTVQAVIEGPTFRLLTPYVKAGEEAILEISFSQASHLEFSINFNDGTDILVFNHPNQSDSRQPEIISKAFQTSVNYTVTLTASNDVTDPPVVVDSPLIVVQAPLDLLELSIIDEIEADDNIILEGSEVNYFLTIPEASTSNMASNVFMQWDFGDGSPESDAYTEALQIPGAQYTLSHTLPAGVTGEITTSVFGYNQVSNSSAQTTFTVQQGVGSLSIEAPSHIAVGEAVDIAVTCSAGTAVRLSLDVGDGSTVDEWTDELVSTRTFTYNTPGTYTLSLSALNDVSSADVVEHTITVQHRVIEENIAFTIPPAVLSDQGTADVSIDITGGDVPTSVMLSVDGASGIEIASFPHVYQLPIASGLANEVVSANFRLYNLVSETSQELSTTVVEPMGEFTLADVPILSTEVEYTGEAVLSAGSNLEAFVLYGDGSPEEQLQGDASGAFSLSHLYDEPGSYELSVRAVNILQETTTASSTIVTQNPIKESEMSVTFDDEDMYIKLQEGTLTLTALATGDKLPTDTSVTVDFGLGALPSETFDFTEAFTKTHTYTAVGIYTITLSMINEVTEEIIQTFELEVLEGIVLDGIEVWKQPENTLQTDYTFALPVELSFRPLTSAGTKLTYKWTFIEEVHETTELDIRSTFTLPGEKRVTLEVYNLVDTATTFVDLNIIANMAIEGIDISNPVTRGSNAVYVTRLKDPDDVCFMFKVFNIEVDDNDDVPEETFWIGVSPEVCRRSETLAPGTTFTSSEFVSFPSGELIGTTERQMDTIAEYRVEIKAFTLLSEPYDMTKSLSVIAKPCFPPVVTNRPGQGESLLNPVQFKRSENNFIGTEIVEIVVNCERTSSVKKYWTVGTCDETGALIREIQIEAEGGTKGEAGVNFPKATLAYGMHCYNLTVTMDGYPEFNASTTLYAKVLETPIEASIGGKEGQRVGHGTSLLIDVENFVVDVDNTDDVVTYQYLCSQLDEEMPDDPPLVHVPQGEVVIVYDNPDSYTGCFNTGAGRLDVTAGSYELFTGHFLAGRFYNLTVIVTKGTRTAMSFTIIEVSEGDPPDVNIECKPDNYCPTKISTQDRLEVWVFSTQLANVDHSIVTYTWNGCIDREKSIPDADMSIFDSDGCIVLTTTSVEYSDGSPASRVTIQPNMLPEGVTFTLTITLAVVGRAEGKADKKFQLNLKPRGGTCRAEPETGPALSEFRLICSGWNDDIDADIWEEVPSLPEGSNFVGAKISHEMRVGDTVKELFTDEPFLSTGDPDNDYRITMTSYISDKMLDRASYQYFVQVKPAEVEPVANLSAEVSSMGTTKALSYFSSLIGSLETEEEEEPDTPSVPDSGSNSGGGDSGSSGGGSSGRGSTQQPASRQQQQQLLVQEPEPDPQDQMVEAVAKNLAKMLTDPSVSNNPDTLLAVFATSKSTLESRTANYPPTSQLETLDLTQDMARQLSAASSLDRKQQQKMAADVLSMANSNVQVAPEEPEEPEITADVTLSEEDLAAQEELVEKQAKEAEQVQKKLAESIESTTDSLEAALQKSLTVNGEAQEIEADNMKMTLKKATSGGLDNQAFESGDGGVELPKMSDILGGGKSDTSNSNVTDEDTWVFSYVYLEDNIYNYDESSKDIDSGISTLAIKNQYGQMKNMREMKDPIEVKSKNPPEAANNTLDNAAISVEDGLGLLYLPVEKAGSSLIYDINLDVTTDMNLTIFILKGLSEENLLKPGPDNNDCIEHQILHAGDTLWESVVAAECVEPPGLMLGFAVAELLIPLDVRRRRSVDDDINGSDHLEEPHQRLDYATTGRVTVTRRAKRAVDDTGGAPAAGATGANLLNNTMGNMKMRTANNLCRSWNKTTNSWTNDVCKVGAKSSISQTVCECREMSREANSYGSGFSMPKVNTIDFSKVFGNFSELLGDNPAVFATVFSILGVYILLAIWARRADKKDVEKWSVTPLVDNRPKHTYYYKVSVYTGLRQGAGTMSNVCFVVNGELSDTGVRMLADGKRKGFQRGTVRHFMMSCEAELGELSFVRIWHDNAGKGENASWFLDKVVIEDIKGKTRYFFLCGRYLSAEEDDGLVDRILSVAGQEQVHGFGHVFFSTARKNLTDDHLWLSVVSRPTKSNFTRLQRLTCCIVLLFSTMIANAMWYGSVDNMESDLSVRIGPIIITTGTILVAIFGSLTVVPINVIIVQLFRKSKSKKATKVLKQNKKAELTNIEHPNGNVNDTIVDEDDDEDDPDAGKKIWKKKYPLPYWCTYIAWALSVMTILASCFFIIFYSLDWGKEKAEKWLSALMLSVFQSTVIIQPVKVVLLAMVVSCVFKKLQEEDDAKEDLETVKKLEQMDDEFANDPVLMLDRQYNTLTAPEPPSKEELAKIRKDREYKKKVKDMIKEFCYYSLYVCLISFIAFGQRDEMSYIMNNGMIQMIGVPEYPTQLKFTSVNDGFKFWQWLEETALPSVFYLKKYNGDLTTMRERNYTDDMVSFRVGPLRLRQVRVKPASCNLNSMMKDFIIECNTPYSIVGEEDRNFTVAWSLSNGTDLPDPLTKLDSAYLYNSMFSLRGLPYVGIMGTYGGGGYVAELGINQLKAIRYLSELREYDWIDYYTRAVFLEFTVYNPNVNLFSYVNFVMEFPATGGVMANPRVMTFQVYSSFTAGGMKTMVILAQILFVLIMLYMFVKECIKMYKLKRKYATDAWNIYELIIIAVSATCVAMFALREVWGRAVLSEISDNKDTYVNYLYLATYDELLMYMLGLILFLAIVKLLRLLRFNRHVWVLVGTLIYARWDLFYFAITFFIFMFGFATLGQVVFGTGLIGFSSFIRTLESLYSMLLGKFDFQGLELINRVLGPLYFVVFVVMMFFIIINMFLGILGDSFTMMKNTPGFEQCEYQVVDYLMNMVKEYVGARKNVQAAATDMPADQYMDAVATLEKRLTSIDRYLTNDYIEETLFSRNKDMLRANSLGAGHTKEDYQRRKSMFKKLIS